MIQIMQLYLTGVHGCMFCKGSNIFQFRKIISIYRDTYNFHSLKIFLFNNFYSQKCSSSAISEARVTVQGQTFFPFFFQQFFHLDIILFNDFRISIMLFHAALLFSLLSFTDDLKQFRITSSTIFKKSATDFKFAIFIHIKIYKIKTILVSGLHFPLSVVLNVYIKNSVAIYIFLLIKSFPKILI